jgi:protein LTV1
MVFAEKPIPNQSKVKHRSDLEDEFGDHVRDNEGEAATYGVYYDDTEYDYMQHLRDVGSTSEAYFFEAPVKQRGKGKQKMSLEDALREMDLQSEADVSLASSSISKAESLLPEDMLPSEFVRNTSYQDQQDVPDAIAGFQPDMDPRLREVLEALEDDAYVDDDEDIFEALAQDGEEINHRRWEATHFDEEEDDGWESDHTVKAAADATESEAGELSNGEPAGDDWMAEFNKFKQDKKAKSKAKPGTIPPDLQSSVQTGASSIAGLKRKKRKGALTSSTGYSMTSSVLRRSEGQSILDSRFDKIQEEYAEDDLDESASMFSGMTGLSAASKMSKASAASEAPSLLRSDFDSIMDDFLGNHTEVGKRRVRRGKPQTGIEQLDEIRKTLGPPRLRQTEKA